VPTPPLGSHEKNALTVTRAFCTWGEVHAKGNVSSVLFGLDSYAEMDFVSIEFVRSQGLKPCNRKNHSHKIPSIEAAGCLAIKTYGVYHLHCTITDRWGRQFSFARPFIAMDRDPKDTPILLGRPALQEFRIILINSTMDWEFERKKKVTEYSTKRFKRMLQKPVQLYEIRACLALPDLPSESPPQNTWKQCLARIQQLKKIANPYRPSGPTTNISDEEDDDTCPPDKSHIPTWLRNKYADVFDDEKATMLPSRRQTDHVIELQPGTEPPFMRTYNLSPKELEALEEFLTQALAKGRIRESTSPAGAPILFSPKKDGGLRLVVDYRGLNAVTVKNRYPLPLISELLDRLNGAKVFSKIDLKDGYYRIRVREGDEWKTAFRTRYGHYEFLVLPMGLTNSPATFQSYINNALRGYTDSFCIAYLDDILIFSQTEEEHREHLELVMERLRQSELYAKATKCSFFQTEIEFLGYIVNSEGVKMDPRRVDAIREWKDHPPKSYRDIQVFIGFCNFYRRFIYAFSRITKPIQNLLRGMKNGRKPGLIGGNWQEAQQKAFEDLIDRFTTAPILRHYDPNLPMRVETDSSRAALAGVLSQQFEDGWHPIAFYSRKFNETEWHYPIYDKEMMAVVMSFEHWRHYLDGATDIAVYTDHQNLKDFMSQTRLNGRQTRWLIKLLPYDFRIFYRKGTLNPADGPSRRPDYLAGAEEIDDTPVTRLLPSLRERVATRDVHGNYEGTTGTESLRDS
jgi:reverse transcriptase-like protein